MPTVTEISSGCACSVAVTHHPSKLVSRVRSSLGAALKYNQDNKEFDWLPMVLLLLVQVLLIAIVFFQFVAFMHTMQVVRYIEP